jgi:diaminopimelate decarboxylase
MGKCAPVSLRVNPDVDAKTHPYISTGLRENKFGIDIKQAVEVYQQAANLKNLKVVGIDCHIGSQLTETRPFIDALTRVMALVEELAKLGIVLQHIDVGGGLGVCYQQETPPSPQEYVAALQTVLGANHSYKILLEPGRAIVGNAGVLLTQVEYLKENTANKHFAIVDAGMNDLIRPSLYQAWQAIVPITQQTDRVTAEYDVVGPVCETGDFLGKSRSLAIAAGDILAVRSSGAYGFVMSSNYNTRPRAAEIMVDGKNVHVIRRRETLEDLLSLESVLP